jgi:sigma-B regulation protein RsbU (phosphoserine phosphatase)
LSIEDREPSRLERLLEIGAPGEVRELDGAELERLLWKYRGLKRSFEREQAFWNSTNDNLMIAYERLGERERELAAAYQTIREDLEVAAQVQKALLPRMLPAMTRELDLAVHQRQLSAVGGDYYDFFHVAAERYAIGVFDISGHGVSSALVMSYLKAQLTSVTERLGSPQRIVEWVNRSALAFLREIRKYATVNFVAFEPQSLRYVCGGGYGYVLRPHGEHLFAKPNHFLGLRDRPFREEVLPFEAGDLLCLYTDGIVEARDSEGRTYTTQRLHRLVAEHRDREPQQIVDAIVADYEAFRVRDSDDVTLLVMRRRQGEPR